MVPPPQKRLITQHLDKVTWLQQLKKDQQQKTTIESNFKTNEDRTYHSELEQQLKKLTDNKKFEERAEEEILEDIKKQQQERQRLLKEKEKDPFIRAKAQQGQIEAAKRKHKKLIDEWVRAVDKKVKELELELEISRSKVLLKQEIERTKKIIEHKETCAELVVEHLKQLKPLETDLETYKVIYIKEKKRLLQEKEKGPYISKNAQEGQIHAAKRKHDKLIDESLRELEKEYQSKQQKLQKLEEDFAKTAGKKLDMDPSYAGLLSQGILPLPSDTRLGAMFPERDSVTPPQNATPNQIKELLYAKAAELITTNRLYKGNLATEPPRPGIITGAREGCVCIMFVKEGDSYRPFFGASSIKPFPEKAGPQQKSSDQQEKDSYTLMGLPVPRVVEDKPNIKNVRYTEVQRQNLRDLEIHVERCKRLGIKPPVMQSQRYFNQVPEYYFNDKRGGVKPDPQLESWSPSNCAEPAIMSAIYQLYHEPKDIYLSVPFEGKLSKKGELLNKYTCARCASAEPAFIVPVVQPDAPMGVTTRVVDQRLSGTGQREEHPLNNENIISNADNRRSAYDVRLRAIEAAERRDGRDKLLFDKE